MIRVLVWLAEILSYGSFYSGRVNRDKQSVAQKRNDGHGWDCASGSSKMMRGDKGWLRDMVKWIYSGTRLLYFTADAVK